MCLEKKEVNSVVKDQITTNNNQVKSVVINENDLLCLRDGEFLNDNIIAFYLK